MSDTWSETKNIIDRKRNITQTFACDLAEFFSLLSFSPRLVLESAASSAKASSFVSGLSSGLFDG